MLLWEAFDHCAQKHDPVCCFLKYFFEHLYGYSTEDITEIIQWWQEIGIRIDAFIVINILEI